MSKFLSAFARSVLQIGGASLGVAGAATNPLGPEAVAGYVVALAGAAWAQYRASKTTKLAKAVDAAPSLPSAREVEHGYQDDPYAK